MEDIFVSHRISSKDRYFHAFKVSSDQRWVMRSLALFTNEQLAQFVQRRCRSKSDLSAIEGVGEAKIDKYAEHISHAIRNDTFPVGWFPVRAG